MLELRQQTLCLICFVFGMFVIASASANEIPCDFKGISVGDKLSPDQIMHRLGISKFLRNPVRPSFDSMQPLYEKYGIAGASELEDWKTGPYCREDSCSIPWGVTVGKDDIPVSVFVSIHSSVITEIDVTFGETYWDDVMAVIENKYGSQWRFDDIEMMVSEYGTHKWETLKRVIAENQRHGVNKITVNSCQMSAENIDIAFRHHDPLGSLHSIFVLKLESNNF